MEKLALQAAGYERVFLSYAAALWGLDGPRQSPAVGREDHWRTSDWSSAASLLM